jgi:hypothetical protein
MQLLTIPLHRGEWYSQSTCIFKVMTSTAVSSFEAFISPPSDWSFRYHRLVYTSMEPCHRQCHAGRWAHSRLPIWYHLDWNITQVVMIARIYAMYQGSKTLLIFLVVMLLASTIASGVMIVIGNLGISARKLDLFMTAWGARDSWTFTRLGRGFLFQLPYLRSQYWHIHAKSELWEYDTHRCMGDPRLVVYGLDCYKTLSWSATIADRIDHWELFRGVNKESRVLLSSVSSVILMYFIRFHWSSAFASFATMACLSLGLLSANIMVRPSVTDICSWPLSHHFSPELIVRGECYLLWHFCNCTDIADVCAGTAFDPGHSRTSR